MQFMQSLVAIFALGTFAGIASLLFVAFSRRATAMEIPMTRLTIKTANKMIRDAEVIITVKDGEYRVSDRYTAMATQFPDETRKQIQERIELRAYYTNDLEDAVNTARFYREKL